MLYISKSKSTFESSARRIKRSPIPSMLLLVGAALVPFSSGQTLGTYSMALRNSALKVRGMKGQVGGRCETMTKAFKDLEEEFEESATYYKDLKGSENKKRDELVGISKDLSLLNNPSIKSPKPKSTYCEIIHSDFDRESCRAQLQIIRTQVVQDIKRLKDEQSGVLDTMLDLEKRLSGVASLMKSHGCLVPAGDCPPSSVQQKQKSRAPNLEQKALTLARCQASKSGNRTPTVEELPEDRASASTRTTRPPIVENIPEEATERNNRTSNWTGVWLTNIETCNISGSDNSLTASCVWRTSEAFGNQQWNCQVEGNTAKCNWTGYEEDGCKTTSRRGTIPLVTLSGDQISGEYWEDEPTFTNKPGTSCGASSMMKGARWPIKLKRQR